MEEEQKCKACGGAHPTGACTESEGLGMDKKGFEIGDVVKVQRSDGTIEANWKVNKFGVIKGTTMVVVVNGDGQDALSKGIPVEDLMAMQNMKTREELTFAQAKRDEVAVPDRKRVIELAPGEKELIDFIETEARQVQDVAGMREFQKKVDEYLENKGVQITDDDEFARQRRMPVHNFTITIGRNNYGFGLSKFSGRGGFKYSILPSGENISESLKILADNDKK